MGFGFWLLESGLVGLTGVVVGNWLGCFGGRVCFGLSVGGWVAWLNLVVVVWVLCDLGLCG